MGTTHFSKNMKQLQFQWVQGNKSGGSMNMSDLFLQWLDSGEYSDCTVVVGLNGHQKKSFKCHRLILATASPIFAEMLKDQADQKIELTNCSPENFDLILRFIYGGQNKIIERCKNFYSGKFIFDFAVQWKIEKLAEQVGTTIIQYGDFDDHVDRLLSWHGILVKHNLNEQADTVLKMLLSRGAELCFYLETACRETVEALLKSDRLNIISEKELFNGLEFWALSQVPPGNDSSARKAAAREILGTMMGLIHFGSLSMEDLALICRSSSTLSAEEKVALFVHKQLNIKDPVLEDFDLTSPWRGYYKRNTFVVKLEDNLCTDFELICFKEKSFELKFEVSSPVYLLAVEALGAHYLKTGEYLDLEVNLTTTEKVKTKGYLEYYKTVTPDDCKVTLTNPTLLDSRAPYTLVLKHRGQVVVPKMLEQKDQQQQVTQKVVTAEGLEFTYLPEHSDVCALVFGWPNE
ncbi:uncharacterized protein LOC132197032 [Neocloeon triangulifer]|uniref:uncharacterized protein LOC132197032 n=1 Tax=Neocloeon triangulifer TaxID=2078957 RepID=UPI00286ED769|nr:uncharacterized protein LOC132197032 [Neocloeon triangulifer]